MKNHLKFFTGEEMKNIKLFFAFMLKINNGSPQKKKTQ